MTDEGGIGDFVQVQGTWVWLHVTVAFVPEKHKKGERRHHVEGMRGGCGSTS